MAEDLRRRWRVKIYSRTKMSADDLPPGIVSEVTEMCCEGTWSVVMTTDQEHIPEVLTRALAWPGFCRFDVWEKPLVW